MEQSLKLIEERAEDVSDTRCTRYAEGLTPSRQVVKAFCMLAGTAGSPRAHGLRAGPNEGAQQSSSSEAAVVARRRLVLLENGRLLWKAAEKLESVRRLPTGMLTRMGLASAHCIKIARADLRD